MKRFNFKWKLHGICALNAVREMFAKLCIALCSRGSSTMFWAFFFLSIAENYFSWDKKIVCLFAVANHNEVAQSNVFACGATARRRNIRPRNWNPWRDWWWRTGRRWRNLEIVGAEPNCEFDDVVTCQSIDEPCAIAFSRKIWNARTSVRELKLQSITLSMDWLMEPNPLEWSVSVQIPPSIDHSRSSFRWSLH